MGDNKVTVAGVAGETFQFENEYTDGTINLKVAEGEIAIDDEAKFYWAAGENATVGLGDYSAESATVDLTNANYNDKENLGFYGDIQGIDATGYAGDADLKGNDKDNVITGGAGNSSLWGGNGGNDTLIGGDGADTFIYGKGNGDDVIENAGENDVVKLDGISLDELVATGNALFDGNDVKIELKEGGSLTVKDAKTNGVTFDIAGTKYGVNKDSGEWEYK